jgi:uncharacterized protein YdeI (YjbR/CyaY-like superfamily)
MAAVATGRIIGMPDAAAQTKCFHSADRADWRRRLAANHAMAPGVWLISYQKASGKPRVTYDEAVEEALCFGWIDSRPSALDAERSMLLFTPGKPRSAWLRPNKRRVEKRPETRAKRIDETVTLAERNIRANHYRQ